MPLPTPGNETANEYVSKCVSFIFHEGTLNGKHMDPKNAHDRKIATAACYSNYRSAKKSNDDIIIKGGLKDKNGYFCRLQDSDKRHYYDIGNKESKETAIKSAQDEWFDLQIDELSKLIEVKQEELSEPIDGDTDTRPPSDDDNKREEFIKACIAKKVSQGESESTAKEQCIQEWDSKHKSVDYIVPKSKDEISQGTVISYKGKIGKVVKVINI